MGGFLIKGPPFFVSFMTGKTYKMGGTLTEKEAAHRLFTLKKMLFSTNDRVYFFSIEFSNTNPDTINSANIAKIDVVIFLPFLYFKLNFRQCTSR